MFGAKQRISEPLSALAVHTGRYREIKHPRPNFSQRVNEINESTIWQWSNRLSYGIPHMMFYKSYELLITPIFVSEVEQRHFFPDGSGEP